MEGKHLEKADKRPAGVPWAFPAGPARSWMLLSTSPALTQAGTRKPALVTPLPGGQVLPTGTQPPLPDAGPEPGEGWFGVGVGHSTLPPVTAEKGCGRWRVKEKRAGGPGVGEMSGDLVERHLLSSS